MKPVKFVSPVLQSIRRTSFEADLQLAGKFAAEYTRNVDTMRVFPSDDAIAGLAVFDEELNEEPVSNREILETLHRHGSGATIAQTGGKYFGFVCGGVLPSSLCSKWLTDTWDQNPAMFVLSPIAAKLEDVCEKWLRKLLHLPVETVAGFVSGSSTAIICGLVAGRNYLLNQSGYDVAQNGLMGADKIKVVLSEGAHSTVYKALSIAGLGYGNVTAVAMDEQGRMRADKLPPLDSTTLLILQAGNVNSGAFDDFVQICKLANKAGAWVHIDGAFGLWVAASPKLQHLTEGMELADSWSLDGHKTLNAPYDNGIILCKRRDALVNAMHMTGGYILLTEDKRDSMMYTMEMSRRARAADLWAALKGLGRQGVAELVEELQAKADYFAQCLQQHGFEILNEVVFNQVLVYYQSDSKTQQLIEDIQKSGVLWLGGSTWQGKSVMRISVCSYKTTYKDIDECVEEIVRLSARL